MKLKKTQTHVLLDMNLTSNHTVGPLFLCVVFLFLVTGCSEYTEGQRISTDDIVYQGADSLYVVYYVGSPSCGICTRDEVVEAVAQIPEGFRSTYDLPVKFVFVAMSHDIDRGLEFMREHGAWDEISLGARYNNETLLQNFNSEVTAAVPHVMVYKDIYSFDEYNIPHLEQREKVTNVVDGNNIPRWVNEGFPLSP